MKLTSKHRKPVFIAGLVIIALVLLGYWQRQVTLSNATETKLKDEPRKAGAVKSTFYSAQLTAKEMAVYEQMKEKLTNKEGGILSFDEPLNGTEYLRITAALEDEGDNYFYGFYDIPMTKEDVYVKYKNPDLTAIKEKIITKSLLFLSCAEGINEEGEYAEHGKVNNLNQIQEGLSVNVEQKAESVEKTKEQTEAILEEIMHGLKPDTGEKSTVDYFLSWLNENMSLATNVGEDAVSFTTMEQVFEGVSIYNNLSALTENKATALGYAKILTELCNRAGLESHIVLGAWGKSQNTQESYVLCAIVMNGQTIYVDASGFKGEDVGQQRYLTEQEAKNHMKFVEYFVYE